MRIYVKKTGPDPHVDVQPHFTIDPSVNARLTLEEFLTRATDAISRVLYACADPPTASSRSLGFSPRSPSEDGGRMQPTRRQSRCPCRSVLSPKMTTTPNLADFPADTQSAKETLFALPKLPSPAPNSRAHSRAGRPENQKSQHSAKYFGLQPMVFKTRQVWTAPGGLGSTPGPLRLRETPARREVLGGRDGLGGCISARSIFLSWLVVPGFDHRADHRAPTCSAHCQPSQPCPTCQCSGHEGPLPRIDMDLRWRDRRLVDAADRNSGAVQKLLAVGRQQRVDPVPQNVGASASTCGASSILNTAARWR